MVEIPTFLFEELQIPRFRHLEEIPQTYFKQVIDALQKVVDQHLVLSSDEMLAAAKSGKFEQIKETWENAADVFARLLDQDFKDREHGGPLSKNPEVLGLRKSFKDIIYGSPEEQISFGLEILKAVTF